MVITRAKTPADQINELIAAGALAEPIETDTGAVLIPIRDEGLARTFALAPALPAERVEPEQGAGAGWVYLVEPDTDTPEPERERRRFARDPEPLHPDRTPVGWQHARRVFVWSGDWTRSQLAALVQGDPESFTTTTSAAGSVAVIANAAQDGARAPHPLPGWAHEPNTGGRPRVGLRGPVVYSSVDHGPVSDGSLVALCPPLAQAGTLTVEEVLTARKTGDWTGHGSPAVRPFTAAEIADAVESGLWDDHQARVNGWTIATEPDLSAGCMFLSGGRLWSATRDGGWSIEARQPPRNRPVTLVRLDLPTLDGER